MYCVVHLTVKLCTVNFLAVFKNASYICRIAPGSVWIWSQSLLDLCFPEMNRVDLWSRALLDFLYIDLNFFFELGVIARYHDRMIAC